MNQSHYPPPNRYTLDGVPKVGFYDGTRCPEDVPFPGCLRAFLEYKGENTGCNHVPEYDAKSGTVCGNVLIMNASGAAYRLLWKPGWHMDNADIMLMSDNQVEPIDRSFKAIGYDYEFFSKEDPRCDKAFFRQQIITSIRDRKNPVLALGVVGPLECSIITGYDEDGDVLIGWSYFQGFPEFAEGLEFEPSGEFRKRNWFRNTKALITVGEKHEAPSTRDTLWQVLSWALEIIHTPLIHGRFSGLAAYDAWIEALLDDSSFNKDDMDALNEHYFVHYDAAGVVAEGRWYASVFLRQMAKIYPEAATDLTAAADCFEAEHDLMWAVWEFAGGNAMTDVQVMKLAERGVRLRIAPMIRLAAEKDAQAADHMERALTKL